MFLNLTFSIWSSIHCNLFTSIPRIILGLLGALIGLLVFWELSLVSWSFGSSHWSPGLLEALIGLLVFWELSLVSWSFGSSHWSPGLLGALIGLLVLSVLFNNQRNMLCLVQFVNILPPDRHSYLKETSHCLVV